LDREVRAFHSAVRDALRGDIGSRRSRPVYHVPPTLEDLREAYAADEIDLVDLERLTEFALAGRVCPDPPPAIESRIYARMQSYVRFSDAPGGIVEYRRPGWVTSYLL
jgi:hypothetical protein